MSAAHEVDGGQLQRRLPEDLHLLAVLNIHSSNYSDGLRQFEQLIELGFCGPTDSIETLKTRQQTGALLGDTLVAGHNEYNGIIVLSGDGGGNTVAHGVFASKDERVEATPLIYGRGGGASDGHTQTQGRRRDYLSTLPHQSIGEVYPLEVTVARGDEQPPRSEIAVLHVAVGNSAAIAAKVNEQDYRQLIKGRGRSVQRAFQYLTGLEATLASHQFTRRWAPDGAPKQLLDWVAVNGNAMGGVAHFPAQLNRRDFSEISVESTADWLRLATRLKLGRPRGFTEQMGANFYVAPTQVGQALHVNFDGETIALPLCESERELTQSIGSLVTVRVAARPLGIAHQPSLAG